MIENTLKLLDLTDKEIAVYLEVMRKGKSTPAVIAKITGINRASVYHVATSLAEKGFLTLDVGEKSMYLVAVPPDNLRNLITEEKKRLEEKEILVEKALEGMQQIARDTQYAIPQIQFVEEKKLEKFLYTRIDDWNASALKYDGTHWGFQDHSYVENFRDWIDVFWEHNPGGISVKLLSNSSQVEHSLHRSTQYPHRDVRYWKKSFVFTASVWAIGDFIVMISTREHPFSLIEIHNPLLAQNLRAFFSSVWKDIITKKK